MDYIITYSALSDCRQVLKQGKMKVKNKMSELHAKSSLEDYFKKKFFDFNKLIVYKCVEDYGFNGIFGDKLNDLLNNYK